ncbi:helix-turn-helix domain-containing protein [Pseudomonas sp. GD03858]|uniref:helix-turn-helix domain-containing protein n=1 Tax=unclassified Pseudomonas TaxID=196821 RepID=UPI00244B1AEA|nr:MULTISPECIES: helix-turn-helix transcriptional regulator [unclassified Pseudomonas]MDH0648069.1 helix-turn-helix domain-containing protein [Pseudomonas sp. GD03867]MDH0663714.1 helix-turn-helix domain-containing protein [Pseudomonas sp. GD03858]
MTIGERLREERSRLGLSQTDLATVGGVGKTTQINYEKGSGSPDARYLSAAAAQGVDVLYVVTGERKREPSASLTASEANVLACYRKLSPADQNVLERTAVALADMTDRQGF